MTDEYEEVIERIQWLFDKTLQLNSRLSSQELEELNGARDRWISFIEEGRRRAEASSPPPGRQGRGVP
jgi:hypothetical protein